MDVLTSETCWSHKYWYKIVSDIKFVSLYSTIKMMHCPINIRLQTAVCRVMVCSLQVGCNISEGATGSIFKVKSFTLKTKGSTLKTEGILSSWTLLPINGVHGVMLCNTITIIVNLIILIYTYLYDPYMKYNRSFIAFVRRNFKK